MLTHRVRNLSFGKDSLYRSMVGLLDMLMHYQVYYHVYYHVHYQIYYSQVHYQVGGALTETVS